MSPAERFDDDITLEYSLTDRMRLRGHVLNLQTITMLRTYFQRVHHVDWIEPSDLQRLTDDFIRFVENYARIHHPPIIAGKPGESHVDQAAPYLERVTDKDEAVYRIIKVQKETSSFVSYVPGGGPRTERKIARGRRRVNHYYRWFLAQVEYSHNLIFRDPDQLYGLFGRLLERGREIGQPHVIAKLFQRKRLQTRRTGGRMQRTRQEDYALKAWHKKTNIKQYNKRGVGLRTETTSYDVREFGMT